MAHRSVSHIPVADPERELHVGSTRAINPQWNQAAAQIGNAIGRAVAKVRKMPQRAERVAEELTNEMRDRLEAIRDHEQGGGVASRLRQRAEQTADELKGRARENVRIVRNRAGRLVRESPLGIIATAFGAAFILGVALRIWRSNQA